MKCADVLFLVYENVAKVERLYHHSWNVERAFEDITLGRLSHSAVAVQIAVPLAAFGIGEVCVCPFAYLLVPDEVLVIASCLVGIECCDDSLGLWPPELHVLRVVLRWQVAAVAEVDDAAILLVPAPFPRPVKYLAF